MTNRDKSADWFNDHDLEELRAVIERRNRERDEREAEAELNSDLLSE